MSQNKRQALETVKQAPLTKERLVEDLRTMGLEQGDVVLMHSSLSAMGWVVGGAEGVLEALFEVIGELGTLVVPCFTGHYSEPAYWENPPVPESWWPMIRQSMPAFDPDRTPSRMMGSIVEAFRAWPETLRSTHPKVSFCGKGPIAAHILLGQSLHDGLGEDSPLADLEAFDAKILLLGVGYDVCSSLHLAESRANFAGKRFVIEGAPIRTEEGRRWVAFNEVDSAQDGEDFVYLGEDFEAALPEHVRRGVVGVAESRVVQMKPLVKFAQEWFMTNRAEP